MINEKTEEIAMSTEKQTKNEKKNDNKKFYRFGRIFFSIAFVIIVILMARDWWVEKQAQKQFESLAGQTENIEQSDTETDSENIQEVLGVEIPEKNLDWDELKTTNEHIYAWIYIPNTKVDYPVLQHPEDDSYYLDYNLDGTKGYPGCIYSEHAYNSTDFMDFNTLLYGHNMKNGTMFKTLHNFKDRKFFEENRYIYIYTPETVYVYDIFAAYENQANHILAYYDNDSETDRARYINDLFSTRDMSVHFRDGVEVTKDSKILTLVTCTGNNDTRYFVQGVMLNPVEENEQ